MPKMPSMSSRELARLLEKGGALFVRQGSTDHAIYSRTIESKRYSAPVQMGVTSHFKPALFFTQDWIPH
jgi:predicted RNA binding protein YcfA (HicA-like mRNA interferase family)